MKKLILTLILSLSSYYAAQATHYITSGEGQGLWSDLDSWRIVGQAAPPAELPGPQDDITIEHFISHMLRQDYVHYGKLTITPRGSYEVLSAGSTAHRYTYAGPHCEVDGTLLLGGDLEHVGEGEMIFQASAWVLVVGSLDLRATGGLLNENAECGEVEIHRDLYADLNHAFIAGKGAMTVNGEIKPYETQGETYRTASPQHIEQVMDGESRIYTSAQDCEQQQPTLSGRLNHRVVVQWENFEAQPFEGRAHLQWRTSAESFGLEFTVERSADGVAFEKIAEIPARGNQNRSVAYQFIDSTVNTARAYYRLRFSDVSDNEEVSDIRTINLRLDVEELEVFPNPYKGGVLTLRTPSLHTQDPVVVTLSSHTGVMISRFATYASSDEELTLERFSHLPTGLYIITLQQGELRRSQQLSIR
jgi:hypothetical protein